MAVLHKIAVRLTKWRFNKECYDNSHLTRLWELYGEMVNESEDETDERRESRVAGTTTGRDKTSG